MSVVIEKARQDPKRIVFPEGRAPEDPARRQDPGRGGDLPADPARARGRRSRRSRGELQLPMDKIDFVNTNRRRSSPATRGASRSCGAATGMTLEDGRAAGARPQRLRSADARRRRRRRRDLGPDPVLSRHDPAGAPDRRHGAGRAAGLGPLHPDAQGPDLLLRRHDGQHRPDGRGAGRDRAADRRRRAALRHRAARRDDLLLELRVEHARERAARSRRRSSSSSAARPDLAIDGEMQADYAVVPEMLEAQYPWATRASGPTS